MVESVRNDITKEEAARRQIERAIRMHFDDDDAICTHVLAHAGGQIAANVCVRTGKPTMASMLETALTPKGVVIHRARYRMAYNYFKHADRDHDMELEHFNEEVTDFLLLEATNDFQFAFGKTTPIMMMFRGWMMSVFPEAYTTSAADLQLVREMFEIKPGMDRVALKRAGRRMMGQLPALQQLVTEHPGIARPPLP